MNQVAVDAEIPNVIAEFTGVGAIRGALQLFRARNIDAQLNADWAKTNRLKMPVLTLGGEGGTGPTLFNQMSTVADTVEGGVIKDCGHWIVIERPEAFLTRVGAFLEGRKTP